jgi:prefoldin subunit 5
LEEKIEEMRGQRKDEDFDTLVEIGQGCSMSACIPAHRKQQIIIHIGLGAFVEMSLVDALAISDRRCGLLNEKLANIELAIDAVESDIQESLTLLSKMKKLSNSVAE